MATLAIIKVGTFVSKNALTIVAGHATSRAGVGVVLRCRDGTDLSRLRQVPADYVVATLAIQTLAWPMLCVAETQTVSASRGWSRRVTERLMAGTA